MIRIKISEVQSNFVALEGLMVRGFIYLSFNKFKPLLGA